jgi:hypothetical protein
VWFGGLVRGRGLPQPWLTGLLSGPVTVIHQVERGSRAAAAARSGARPASSEAVHGMRSGRSASGQGRARLQRRYLRKGTARSQAVYVHGLVRRSADVRICRIEDVA